VGEAVSRAAAVLGAAARCAGGQAGLGEALEGLGPSFVKAGQTLATRPDLVGEAVAAELSRLQATAAPFPSAEALAILEEELGQPLGVLFRELSPEPVAAASLGQVYRGVTRDGRAVAVKVQRPGALAQVRTDLALLTAVLRAVRGAVGMSRDLTPLAEEVGAALCGELDYEAEARNLREFSASLRGQPGVVVPEPLEELSTCRVLTLEWVEGRGVQELTRLAAGAGGEGATEGLSAGESSASGRPVTGDAIKAAERARIDLLRLVNMGVDSSLFQLLESGIMHGDPHPGNLLLTEAGELAYLDLGQLFRVDSDTRAALLACIVHLALGNCRALVAALDRLGLFKPEMSQTELEADLEQELSQRGPRSWTQFRSLAGILGRLGVKYKFLLPPSYTILLRSLGTLEGVALSVDSEFEMVKAAVPYAINRLLAMDSGEVASILAEALPEDVSALATVVEKVASAEVDTEAFSALPCALQPAASDVGSLGQGLHSQRPNLVSRLQRLDLPGLIKELDRRGSEDGLGFLSSAVAVVAASIACAGSIIGTGTGRAPRRGGQAAGLARGLAGTYAKQVWGRLSDASVRRFIMQTALKCFRQLWQRAIIRPSQKLAASVIGVLRRDPAKASMS